MFNIKLVDLGAMVFLSVALAWFLMFPFTDFLASKTATKVVEVPCSSRGEVQTLPRPSVNYNMPCDDTDCLEEQSI